MLHISVTKSYLFIVTFNSFVFLFFYNVLLVWEVVGNLVLLEIFGISLFVDLLLFFDSRHWIARAIEVVDPLGLLAKN